MSGRKPYYTPDDIIKQIGLLMTGMDLEAFKTDGRTLFYSGPHGVVKAAFDKLFGPKNWKTNHERGFEQAAWEVTKPLTILDRTEAGLFAEHFDINENDEYLNLYAYYNNWAKKEGDKLTGGDPEWGNKTADRVMFWASEKFAQAVSGDTYTAVCGAGLNRTFYLIELPALVENKKVSTINSLPMDMVREIWEIDPYEAFRAVCIAELKEVKAHAQKTGADKDWNDYYDRVDFFRQERKDHRTRFPQPSPETKHVIQDVLNRYSGPSRPVILMKPSLPLKREFEIH